MHFDECNQFIPVVGDFGVLIAFDSIDYVESCAYANSKCLSHGAANETEVGNPIEIGFAVDFDEYGEHVAAVTKIFF